MGLNYKPISFTVKGEELNYNLTQFPATKALKNLSRLTRLLGVPFMTLAKARVSGKTEAEKNAMMDLLPQAVTELVNRMEDEEVVALVKDLASAVVFENEPITAQKFDTHFQGRVGHLIAVVGEVVRFNYDDFLSVLARAGAAEMARAKSTSTSPSTSNG